MVKRPADRSVDQRRLGDQRHRLVRLVGAAAGQDEDAAGLLAEQRLEAAELDLERLGMGQGRRELGQPVLS